MIIAKGTSRYRSRGLAKVSRMVGDLKLPKGKVVDGTREARPGLVGVGRPDPTGHPGVRLTMESDHHNIAHVHVHTPEKRRAASYRVDGKWEGKLKRKLK